MLNILSEKLQNILGKLKNKGKISEKDIKDSLREIKLALLEADVNYKVVKDFISRLEKHATQEELSEVLTPGQHMVKLTHEVLTEILGNAQSEVKTNVDIPTIILLVGLQGSGKTTTAAKLSSKMKSSGHNPLLVAADKIRPAAVEQLHIMGKKAGVEVFSRGSSEKALQTLIAAKQYAIENKKDIIIIDTAGRLHIDQKLLEEIKKIKKSLVVHETLLVLDSLMGQDALTVADTFNQNIGLDGYILTKLDGDARGGVTLSIKSITALPIKYIGVGEKINDIEPFYPDRMSSRILGMGDTVGLIEKIEANYNRNELKKMAKKEFREQFDLNDFYEQLKRLKNMGSMEKIFEMLPIQNLGFAKKLNQDMGNGEKELSKVEAMICSMTKQERAEPEIVNGSRRKRIAKGSGTNVSDVNKLLKQFYNMKKFLKQGPNKKSMDSFFR